MKIFTNENFYKWKLYCINRTTEKLCNTNENCTTSVENHTIQIKIYTIEN